MVTKRQLSLHCLYVLLSCNQSKAKQNHRHKFYTKSLTRFFPRKNPSMKPSSASRFSLTFSHFLTLYCLLTQTHVAQGSHQWQSPIKTVVVLVLENRSFDHLLGWMKNSVNPTINGVTGQECNPVPNSTQTICFTSDAEFVDPDPGHSFEAVEQQVFGSGPGQIPSMMGFVEQALSMPGNLSETVMKGFRPEAVPVYAELVKEFAVFDRWFSSIPGPTQPNRLFVYSATSHGSTSHVKKQLAQG